MAKKYDSTVARIAGNLLSGVSLLESTAEQETVLVYLAVRRARYIAAEVERTEPATETVPKGHYMAVKCAILAAKTSLSAEEIERLSQVLALDPAPATEGCLTAAEKETR